VRPGSGARFISCETSSCYEIIDQYGDTFPEAITIFEDGLEDALQYYDFLEIDAKKILSTNTIERFNKEIRSCSRVIGIFPSVNSYMRLICSYLMEYEEDCQTGRSYIKATPLATHKGVSKMSAS